jgi:hypothetical protein
MLLADLRRGTVIIAKFFEKESISVSNARHIRAAQ